MENKDKIRQEIERISVENAITETRISLESEHMVKSINQLCRLNGGEIDLDDFCVDGCELPNACYDGDGDSFFSDPFAKITMVKAEKHKNRKGEEYEGFHVNISAESCDAMLDDNELCHQEILCLFRFLTEKENLETIMDNE